MVLRTLRDIFLGDPRAGRAMIEQRQATAGGRIVPWTAGRPQWPARTIDTYDQGAYRRVGLIWRCVHELSGAAGSAPLRVYQRVGDEPQQVDDHPLRRLMQRPNPGMGEARFLSFIAMQMAVTGYVVIEKERDALGNVIGLWPLRTDWLRAIPRQQAAPDWEYRVPGYQEPFLLRSQDVIALPYADTPDGSPLGIGPLEVLLREIGITTTMRDFVKVFFDRGAMPLYVMVPSDDPRYAKQWEDQSVKDAFVEQFRRRYGGLPNAVEPMPLVGIKDIKPLGFDFNELAYPELTKMTEATIATTFGVPAILVGAQVGLERSTFSNTAEARRAFFEDTMTYLWSRLDDAFTRTLLPEFELDTSYDVQFDTSDIPALQDDENDRVTRAVSLFNSGLVSRHNGQRHAGVKPHGADVFLVPFNMTEVANSTGTGQRAAYIEVGGPVEGSLLRRVRDVVEIDTGELKRLAEPRIVTRDGRHYLNERALSVEERAKVDTAVTVQRKSIAQLAGLLEPKVSAYLSDQAGRIVRAITNGERSRPTPNGHGPAVMASVEMRAIEDIDWQAEERALLDILEAWLVDVEQTAMASTTALVGDIAWSTPNPFLPRLVNTLGRRIVDITETTRATVEQIVTNALTEGTSMPDLADLLREHLAPTYAGRAENVARTESMHAFGHASQMGFAESGVVNEVMIADNPNHSDPYLGAADSLTCSQRNGIVVPLNRGMFHVSSDHPRGSCCMIPVVTPVEG